MLHVLHIGNTGMYIYKRNSKKMCVCVCAYVTCLCASKAIVCVCSSWFIHSHRPVYLCACVRVCARVWVRESASFWLTVSNEDGWYLWDLQPETYIFCEINRIVTPLLQKPCTCISLWSHPSMCVCSKSVEIILDTSHPTLHQGWTLYIIINNTCLVMNKCMLFAIGHDSLGHAWTKMNHSSSSL